MKIKNNSNYKQFNGFKIEVRFKEEDFINQVKYGDF